MLIAVPVRFPVSNALGIHPMHFAIVMQVSMTMGNVTPPVGVCIFIAAAVSGLKVTEVIYALLPFLAVLAFICFLLVMMPDALLFLPRVFGYGL